jgi:hypothetical protein
MIVLCVCVCVSPAGNFESQEVTDDLQRFFSFLSLPSSHHSRVFIII